MTRRETARVKQLTKMYSIEKKIITRMRHLEKLQLDRRLESGASSGVSSPLEEEREALERGQ